MNSVTCLSFPGSDGVRKAGWRLRLSHSPFSVGDWPWFGTSLTSDREGGDDDRGLLLF